MLKIFQAPLSLAFGLWDRFNSKMVAAMNAAGIPCTASTLWPDFWTRHLFFSGLPYLYPLFRSVVAPASCRLHLTSVQSNDVVWVNGASLPIIDTECWFERQAIKRGASYVFWLEDDWFSDPKLRPTADARMVLADLTVAVTPSLRDRILQLYPGRRVVLLEEPIDVERLAPERPERESQKGVVLWTGRPWALQGLVSLNGVLERVYRDTPFTLRIVVGGKRPNVSLSIPWEWLPYSRSREAAYAAGALAGLAPLDDTVFNRCKGNYKVKTYMALGVPPLVTAIGYNNHLIRNGETGFLLTSEGDWEIVLRTMLTDTRLAAKIGDAARAHIIEKYSYKALMPVWAAVLQDSFPRKLMGTSGQRELSSARDGLPKSNAIGCSHP